MIGLLELLDEALVGCERVHRPRLTPAGTGGSRRENDMILLFWASEIPVLNVETPVRLLAAEVSARACWR